MKISKNTNLLLLLWLSIPMFLISGCNKEDNHTEFLVDYISRNSPLITAHRGYAAVAPENTMSAFEAAVNAGADACEFDVHMTLDGTLVVFHDDTIGRTTNGTGVLSELTYEDSEENIRGLVASKVDFLTTNYLERAIGIKKEMQNK